MKLTLKKLELQNFKGIKKLDINFKEITNIEGANRSGKSTIFDGLTWLLFGKNAEGKQDFGVKRFLADGSTTTKSEVLIIGFFDIDGKELIIKRTLREKWVKKRGEKEPIFSGNETIYEWNDAPIQLKEFQIKINSLIDENFFKLVTNPFYFESLKWEKRREMLINLVPKGKINSLYANLSESDFNELVSSLKAKIKKTKDELKFIPTRIDEANNNKPAPEKWDDLFRELQNTQQDLTKIDNQIVDKSKVLTEFNESRIKDQTELNNLEFELNRFESDFKLKNNVERTELEQKIQANNSELQKVKNNIESLEADIENFETQKKFHEGEKKKKLAEWHKISELVFTEAACVTCGQKLPGTDIAKQKETFIFNRDAQIDTINIEGNKINYKLGELEQKIKQSGQKILDFAEEFVLIQKAKSEFERELNSIKEPDAMLDKKYCTLHQNHVALKAKFDKAQPPTVDASELKEKKINIQTEIDELKTKLNKKTQIAEIDSRIKDLETQETTKAQILLDLENKQFECEEFIKEKITLLTKEINKKFKFVKFKMFETQINGGQKETCTTLINGVPFSDANSESKLNAGLDIINVFSEHYDISAPVFLDNREGVTDIIKTNSQIINLIVNSEHKTLKIS